MTLKERRSREWTQGLGRPKRQRAPLRLPERVPAEVPTEFDPAWPLPMLIAWNVRARAILESVGSGTGEAEVLR